MLSNKAKYITSVDNLITMYAKASSKSVDYASEIAKLLNAVEKNKVKQDKLLELYTDEDR